jgi:hypothetical protein
MREDLDQRRDNTGNRVGATPILDQAPTNIPKLKAIENQNKVLPPKKIRAMSGNKVVRDV